MPNKKYNHLYLVKPLLLPPLEKASVLVTCILHGKKRSAEDVFWCYELNDSQYLWSVGVCLIDAALQLNVDGGALELKIYLIKGDTRIEIKAKASESKINELFDALKRVDARVELFNQEAGY